MIYFIQPGSDMMADDYKYEAITNTVNTKGVMGSGIAKLFIDKYPYTCGMFNYLCTRDSLEGGTVRIYPNKDLESNTNPKYLVMFATKADYKDPSEYEYIEIGLKTLMEKIKELQIKSIAIPPLGCGLGGLEWSKVKPMIIEAITPLADVCDFFIYEQ